MGEPVDPQADEDANVQRRRAAVADAAVADAAGADADAAAAAAAAEGVVAEGVAAEGVANDAVSPGGAGGTGAGGTGAGGAGAGVMDAGVDTDGGQAVPFDREAVIARWLRYARSEECHARLLRHEGEQPFDRLRDVRAQVRRAAAELLDGCADIEQAAQAMMRRVQHLTVREPPLLQFDEAMLAYTQARTWQACALELSPGLRPLQPVWA